MDKNKLKISLKSMYFEYMKKKNSREKELLLYNFR